MSTQPLSAEQKTVCRDDLCMVCAERHFGPEKRACPYCGTIFDRNGKQVYCCKACTVKANEDRRRVKKRTYMRAYQRVRRQQAEVERR